MTVISNGYCSYDGNPFLSYLFALFCVSQKTCHNVFIVWFSVWHFCRMWSLIDTSQGFFIQSLCIFLLECALFFFWGRASTMTPIWWFAKKYDIAWWSVIIKITPHATLINERKSVIHCDIIIWEFDEIIYWLQVNIIIMYARQL